jgi:carbon-monoxide dehydrogenase iron sulfur subunit
MKIKVEKEKCSGCHLCETVCSLYHLGFVNTEKSAIRIEKDDLDTSFNAPVLCRQCKKMKCLSGEARDPEKERWLFIWDRTRAERCPFRALHVFDGFAYHCDLCGGSPQCLIVCTPGALSI